MHSYPSVTYDDLFNVTYGYYLTTWAFLLFLLHSIIHPYVDLLFLSTTVFIVGTFIFFINPGICKVNLYKEKGKEREYQPSKQLASGWVLLVHTMFHVLPFILIVLMYRKYYRTRKFSSCTVVSICIILLYLSLVNINNIYDISDIAIATYFAISVCVYSII